MDLRFDKERITRLSSEMLSALRKIRDLAALPEASFLQDPYKVAAAKYLLIVCIESAIDMCNHVITRNRLRIPEDYADVFLVLGEAGILDEPLVGRLGKMARFRNRLVHVYWSIDDAVVHRLLSDGTSDIEEFMSKFTQSLAPGEGSSDD